MWARSLLRSLRSPLVSLLAPEDGAPNGTPRILRPIVESAADAYLWWREALTGTPMPARPRDAGTAGVGDPPGPTGAGTPTRSSLIACYTWMAERWDPVWVAPRGGHHKDVRPMRLRNRDGRSLRQVACDWGMATARSAALGSSSFDALVTAGVILRLPSGSYTLTPAEQARDLLRDLR